jgi:hypothetical protein
MPDENTGSQPGYRRRIMRALKINEISAVDRPAQEGARALIMKRHEGPDDGSQTEKRGGDFVDVLTGETDGHQHGLRLSMDERGVSVYVAYATSGRPEEHGHDHVVARDADGNWVVSANAGHTHEIDQDAMARAVSAFLAKGEAAGPDGTTETGKAGVVGEEGATTMTDKTQAELEQLQKRAERAEAILSMPEGIRKHFDGLAAADQDAFLALTADKRAESVAKAAEANAVVYTAVDGTEYRKSDDPRLVALAKQNDELVKGAAKSAADRADAEVTELAKSLQHLPGDLDTRKALVKSVMAIVDEDTRKSALEALKAQDAALGVAFKNAGTSSAPVVADGSAEQELDTLAKAHAAEKGLTYAKAYSEVLKTEKGAALYAKTIN